MSTIYIVTSGEYSGYGIDAVFSTKELAEAYVEQSKQTKSHYDAQSVGVEEWTLDESADVRSTPLWAASIDLEAGEIKEGRPCGDALPALWPQGKRGQVIGPKQWGVRAPWADVLSSVSQDHANKLAAETRQRWLRDEAYRSEKRLDLEVRD